MEPDEINAITTRLTAQWLGFLQQRAATQHHGTAASQQQQQQQQRSFMQSLSQMFNTSNALRGGQDNQFLEELKTYGQRVLQYEDKELLVRRYKQDDIQRSSCNDRKKPRIIFQFIDSMKKQNVLWRMEMILNLLWMIKSLFVFCIGSSMISLLGSMILLAITAG